MKPTVITLTTPRLTLQPLTSPDVPALHALWTDGDVRRYLWDDKEIPIEQTREVVAASERLFATERLGVWGARTRDDHALCGFGGFWYFRDPPELELLYGLHRAYWGRGLATELARAVVDYGRATLNMREIRASTDVPNVASARVLDRLGFELERRATVNGLDTLFYCWRTNGVHDRQSG